MSATASLQPAAGGIERDLGGRAADILAGLSLAAARSSICRTGGAGVAANQFALNAGGQGGGGHSVHVGEVNIAQTAHANTGANTVDRIRRTMRAWNADIGLA